MSSKRVCCVCHRAPGVVHLPVDDGAVLTCWPCAHQMTVHEHDLETVASGAASCGCPHAAIYPTEISGERAG